MDGTLCDLAQTRAAECSQSFSGTRPNGQSWSSVLEGCGWLYSGENRIYGSTDLGAELIVDTWYSSDSHRANILSSNYLTCGIGIYRSGNTCYIVVLFAG